MRTTKAHTASSLTLFQERLGGGLEQAGRKAGKWIGRESNRGLSQGQGFMRRFGCRDAAGFDLQAERLEEA
jgi:hypothetical protein